MKISLMYGILLMLINNGRIRRDEIAAHFEISPRTVQRYVEELAACGMPVESVPGPRGGYVVPDSYKLPYVLFTAEELDRLRLCADALTGTFKDEIGRSVRDKLAALSEGRIMAAETPPLVIDSDAWNGSSGAVQPKLDAVGAAVSARRTIRINYTDKTGRQSYRLLDPYTAALKEGVWYVYGWCHVHGEFRLFRLARMKSIELTDDTFAVWEGAAVRAALSVNLGDRINLELSADENCLTMLEEWLGAESVRREDGRIFCRAIVGDGEDLVRKILSFGSGVKVLSPRSVAERTRAAAAGILSVYGG